MQPADHDPALLVDPDNPQCAAEIAGWRRIRAAEQRLVLQIAGFAAETWGPRMLKEGFYWFSRDSSSSESLRDALPMFDRWFVFTFVPRDEEYVDYYDPPVPEDWPAVPLGLTWLASGAANPGSFDQGLVIAAAASPFSLLLVEAVRPRWFLNVRDLFSGRRFHVIDPDVSCRARPHDLLFSAIVTLDGICTLSGPAPVTLPSDWRTDAVDLRRVYTETWMTREELTELDWELLHAFRQAYDVGPAHSLDSGSDIPEPLLLRWSLSTPFSDALRALRESALYADDVDDAIEPDFWPDGTPHVIVTWFESKPFEVSFARPMLAYLYVEDGSLVADVATRRMANRLLAEVSVRLGAGATLIEVRSSMPTRVHDGQSVMPVAAEWWPTESPDAPDVDT